MIILTGAELKSRLDDPREPLVEPYKVEQIQPNGVELTLDAVARAVGRCGRLGTRDTDRLLPEYEPLDFDDGGWIWLAEGMYLVTYAETVRVHRDLFAIGRPRSSLLRMGAAIYTALWDSGYFGRSQSLLTVFNPAGIELERGARLIQLVFFKLGSAVEKGYEGTYKGENV